MNIASLFGSINYFAVTVCMAATIAIGSIWYSPKAFFPRWWKGIGKGETKPGNANMALIFGLTFVSSWVKCLGLALLINLVGPLFGPITVLTGLLLAFGAWLFAIAPTYLTNHLFAGWKFDVYAIMVGNHLLDFLVAGIILSVWR